MPPERQSSLKDGNTRRFLGGFGLHRKKTKQPSVSGEQQETLHTRSASEKSFFTSNADNAGSVRSHAAHLSPLGEVPSKAAALLGLDLPPEPKSSGSNEMPRTPTSLRGGISISPIMAGFMNRVDATSRGHPLLRRNFTESDMETYHDVLGHSYQPSPRVSAEGEEVPSASTATFSQLDQSYYARHKIGNMPSLENTFGSHVSPETSMSSLELGTESPRKGHARREAQSDLTAAQIHGRMRVPYGDFTYASSLGSLDSSEPPCDAASSLGTKESAGKSKMAATPSLTRYSADSFFDGQLVVSRDEKTAKNLPGSLRQGQSRRPLLFSTHKAGDRTPTRPGHRRADSSPPISPKDYLAESTEASRYTPHAPRDSNSGNGLSVAQFAAQLRCTSSMSCSAPDPTAPQVGKLTAILKRPTMRTGKLASHNFPRPAEGPDLRRESRIGRRSVLAGRPEKYKAMPMKGEIAENKGRNDDQNWANREKSTGFTQIELPVLETVRIGPTGHLHESETLQVEPAQPSNEATKGSVASALDALNGLNGKAPTEDFANRIIWDLTPAVVKRSSLTQKAKEAADELDRPSEGATEEDWDKWRISVQLNPAFSFPMQKKETDLLKSAESYATGFQPLLDQPLYKAFDPPPEEFEPEIVEGPEIPPRMISYFMGVGEGPAFEVNGPARELFRDAPKPIPFSGMRQVRQLRASTARAARGSVVVTKTKASRIPRLNCNSLPKHTPTPPSTTTSPTMVSGTEDPHSSPVSHESPPVASPAASPKTITRRPRSDTVGTSNTFGFSTRKFSGTPKETSNLPTMPRSSLPKPDNQALTNAAQHTKIEQIELEWGPDVMAEMQSLATRNPQRFTEDAMQRAEAAIDLIAFQGKRIRELEDVLRKIGRHDLLDDLARNEFFTGDRRTLSNAWKTWEQLKTEWRTEKQYYDRQRIRAAEDIEFDTRYSSRDPRVEEPSRFDLGIESPGTTSTQFEESEDVVRI